MPSKKSRLLSPAPADPVFLYVLRILIVVAILQMLAGAFILAPRLVSTVAGQLASKARLHEAAVASINTNTPADALDLKTPEKTLSFSKSPKAPASLISPIAAEESPPSLVLKEVSPKSSSSGMESGLQPGASLGIISVEHSSGNEGEHILKIAIKSGAREPISVPDVKVQVYFYDQLNGEVVASKSPVASRWLSSPMNWKEGEPELLEVTYQPDNNNPDAHYLGYVVAIYYKGELQGYRADPPTITTQFPIKVYVGRNEF